MHWNEHENLVLDVDEDTFDWPDHVIFRNLGAQTIFHLGAYDDDYEAYHSPSETLDNMVSVVGGQEIREIDRIRYGGCNVGIFDCRPTSECQKSEH